MNRINHYIYIKRFKLYLNLIDFQIMDILNIYDVIT